MSVFASFSLALLTLKSPLLVKQARQFPVGEQGGELQTISIVIPARNEEGRLGKLLDSIAKQSFAPYEVLVVDDESTDNTAQIAKEYGANVVKVQDRPDGFAPKAFACDFGFRKSSGDVVVFLDADTYLGTRFIETITAFFSHSGKSSLSVQPFHRTGGLIQSLSFYFHFVSIIASGLLSFLPFSLGLFGPCIAITKKAYKESGGFANSKVRSSLIEDVELGKQLKKSGISCERYLGNGLIEYVMYSNFKDMFFGWIKNISRGASKANPLLLLVIVAYVGSVISIPFYLLNEGLSGEFGIYLLLQFILLLLLSINVAVRLGNYFLASFFFPISLAFFLFTFFVASLAQIFGLKTRWAGRKLESRRLG